MKKTLIALSIAGLTSIAGFNTLANAATPVPCEDVLKTLTDALAKTKLNDADMKNVADLKAKGEERCTAEDDRRADDFFNQALAIVTKK